MLDRIFNSFLWKLVVGALFLFLFLSLYQWIFSSGEIIHLAFQKGLVNPSSIVELQGWGRLSGVLLLIIFLAAAYDLLSAYRSNQRFSKIAKVIEDFAAGNEKVRVGIKDQGNLKEVALAFNNLADRVVESVSRLKNKEKELRELVELLAHDLGTPLTVIGGYVETLKAKVVLNSEGKKSLDVIEKKVNELQDLLRELLEILEIEELSLRFNAQSVDLVELVQQAVESFKPLAAKRNLKIIADLNVPELRYDCDQNLMRRALGNLVENAIKYTEEGQVRVKLIRDSKQISIVVEDTGLGIDIDQSSSLTERYVKGKQGSFNNGFGLGLALVDRVAQLHSGELLFSKRAEKGSEVKIKLKIA